MNPKKKTEHDSGAVENLRFKPKTDASNSPRGSREPVKAPGTIVGESINDDLKSHALSLADWRHADVVALFHEWATRFNTEFRLDLETPAIAVARIPVSTLGTYCPDRNGFGLQHEITMNSAYLTRPLAEQLATLCHELIHQWQNQYGKSGQHGYHNRQFRIVARRFGFVVDERGHHLAMEPGPFTKLLARYGIDGGTFPTADEATLAIKLVTKRLSGNSKQKKWSCQCTNVRCAKELQAQCFRCGGVFEMADS